MGAYDLTTVSALKAYMHLSSGDLEEDAIALYCSDGAATAATVEVTSDASSADLVLTVTGGTGATATLDLTSDVHDTLTELVSVINGLSGWTAQLKGVGAATSSDLVVLAATSCLAVANEVTLTITDNYLLAMLIEQATVIIERELGYQVLSRDYENEKHSGTGSYWLWLEHPNITSVQSVYVDHDTAMSLTYSGGDASRATVEVTTTGLTLRKVVGGTASSDVLAFASYATITLLAAAVDALTGWETTTEDNWTGYAPTDLIQAGARHSNGAWLSLVVPEDCADTYEVYGDAGKLYNKYRWNSGNMNIAVDYTAGYSSVPDPLASACLELCQIMYNMTTKDASLRSEKLGDYSYTMADRLGAMFSATGVSSISNTVLMKISPFRRLMIWA